MRSKCHVRFRVLASRPVDKATGLRCDQTIHLTTRWSRRYLSFLLRRVRLYDAQRRWQVELFFRWIKQHLRHFIGRSPNTVRSQVWCAICAYLLVYIAKNA